MMRVAFCLVALAFTSEQFSPTVIHAYRNDLLGIHTSGRDVKLRVGRDSAIVNEPVLFVEYPAPASDPAMRDVRLDADNRNWTGATAISFRIKPSHAMRFSVSFVDRNHVVYTAWTNVEANTWQSVRIPLNEIRPNPYFQPPNAKNGLPLDISEVNAIAFAPQDRASGSFAIGQLMLLR